MKINRKTIYDKLIWLVVAFMYYAITAYIMESWGRYVLAGCAVVLLFLTALRDKGLVRVHVGPWHFFFLGFILYCAFSSLWSIAPSGAIGTSTTLLLMLVTFAFVYLANQDEPDVAGMLNAIKWGGFGVAIYAISYYGYENLSNMVSDELRLENDLANANSLGIVAAISVVIQTYETSRKKKFSLGILACLPAIFLLAATQSRKALLLVVIGIVLTVITQMLESKVTWGRLLRTVFGIVIAGVAILWVLRLPIFAGVLGRMEDFSALFTGESGDGAARNQLIRLGWEYFLKYPIAGTGFGSPRVLVGRHLGTELYMHNNYVELLCGGGIIAFAIYYGMYVYLFYNLYKYRKYRGEEYWLCVILLVLQLIMDYAMVSAYDKSAWLYMVFFFLEVRALKQRANAQNISQKET